jgi:hypothetical protein
MRSFLRLALLAFGLTFASAGCTTMTLERYTLNQIRSLTDQRYHQTLDCLAAVAAHPDTLPPYCLVTAGNTKISDSATLTPVTVWDHLVPSSGTAVRGFASQVLGVSLSRAPTEYWTLIPVSDHSQLEAIRCACQWVLFGPDRACSSCPGLLASPLDDFSAGPHFGVMDRLHRLPPCWLHVGRLRDVPLGAAYCGHHGDTWVWVMPDGLEGLADFTLVLLDISTLDASGSGAPRIIITLDWLKANPELKDAKNPKSSKVLNSAIECTETRVVKHEKIEEVEKILFSNVDLRTIPWADLTTAVPAARTNVSPTGPSPDLAALRSEVSAQRFGGAGPGSSTFPFTNPLGPSRTFPWTFPITPRSKEQ